MKIKDDPYYQEGHRIGKKIAEALHTTIYSSLDEALAAKEGLLKRFKDDIQWPDDHPEVLDVKGVIAALEEAKENVEEGA